MKPLFELEIEAPDDNLSLEAFATAIERLKRLLSELAAPGTGRRKRPTWIIASLRMSSPPVVGVGVINAPKRFSATQLRDDTIMGINSLSVGGSTPQTWSPRAIKCGYELLSTVDKKSVSSMSIRNGHSTAEITYAAAVEARKRMPVGHVDSVGSIDGMLELIDVHGGLYVAINRKLDDKRVKASFERSGKKMQNLVKRLLGRRVLATGIVKWDDKGQPREITISHLASHEQPRGGRSILDMYGSDPNFTGDLTPEEYIRRQRGE